MEEIVAPDFGESVFEASVGKWFKSAGETVNVGEPIVELHTDKAVQEISALQDGVVGTILKQADDIVRPGDALCEFQSENAVPEVSDDAREKVPTGESEVTVAEIKTENTPKSNRPALSHDIEEEEDGDYVTIQLRPSVEVPPEPMEKPVAEVVSEEAGLPDEVIDDGESPTVEKTIEPDTLEPSTSDSSVYSAELESQIARLRRMEDGKPVRRERLSRRKLTTARRMSEVQTEAVMTTTYNEVDMHEVIRIRRDFGERFMETNGVKLGFMSFFVKAVLHGLQEFPIMNSELDDNELIYKEYYDIGVAVASDHGLVVPVIRDADAKSFAAIEREIRGFAEKARNGSFSLADLVGGTFTITNGGIFGSMMSTPILNPPQVGILGMHNIVDRAVVADRQITIRPMMYLAVTYDHRVVEGAQAVQFLMHIKQSLESAELLMLAN
jgi:2-oxoglutarate dehydrogenase E2 component (dihydrolipoamide succinyltransferase)